MKLFSALVASSGIFAPSFSYQLPSRDEVASQWAVDTMSNGINGLGSSSHLLTDACLGARVRTR